mgnify:CR=1 FL=1
MKSRALARIRIRPAPRDRRRGWLLVGHLILPCAVGRGGFTRRKREGDGATPCGTLLPLQLFFRPDGVPRRPSSPLPSRPIRQQDGWCDDPGDARYNGLLTLPAKARHEVMWRDDRIYDRVVDLDWNRGKPYPEKPRKRGVPPRVKRLPRRRLTGPQALR